MSAVKKEAGKAAEKAPVENTEPQVVVGTNPLTIPWPQDQQGALASLKKGGVDAAKRVNGDKEKLARLLTTLKLIEAHAKAKYKADAEARQAAKVNAISAPKLISAATKSRLSGIASNETTPTNNTAIAGVRKRGCT